MDHLAANSPAMPAGQLAVMHAAEQSYSFSLQHLIPLLAIFVWAIEYKRRTRSTSDIELGQRLFRQLMPEMLGLTLLCGLVVVLLVCHREDHALQGDEAWKDVKREWPLLMTADSLIGLQAMLRLVFLLSASLRRTGAHLSPLDGEPAAFFLLAAGMRVTLLALSPRDVYHLDGPLGGDMNVALEVTSFLLLLPLGCRMLQKGFCRVVALMLVVMLLAASAKNNHFALADSSHSHLDQLFSLVILLEIVAGVAFYVRSARVKGSYAYDVFAGFAHILLPLQQALPAYFLLVAFAPPFQVEPSLVGKGRPFELLQAGALMQLAMYFLALLAYYISCVEEKTISAFAAPVPLGEAPPADECVICLGSCDGSEEIKPHWRRLRCGHHFHESCIFQWLKKAQRCPMCRRDIKCEKDCAKWKGGDNSTPILARPLETGDSTATEESVPLLDGERAAEEDLVGNATFQGLMM